MSFLFSFYFILLLEVIIMISLVIICLWKYFYNIFLFIKSKIQRLFFIPLFLTSSIIEHQLTWYFIIILLLKKKNKNKFLCSTTTLLRTLIRRILYYYYVIKEVKQKQIPMLCSNIGFLYRNHPRGRDDLSKIGYKQRCLDNSPHQAFGNTSNQFHHLLLLLQ